MPFFELVHNKKRISFPLLEASMDGEWVLLSDNSKGLMSCGHYTCYALVVSFQEKVALAHISNSDGLSEFLKEILADLGAVDYREVTVHLARSFTGYTVSLEDDIKDSNNQYVGESAEQYFLHTDKEYINLLKKDFPSLKLELLTMPHDFLVIESTGKINLYEKFEKDITYERAYPQAKKSARQSSSPHYFNSSSSSTSIEYTPSENVKQSP